MLSIVTVAEKLAHPELPGVPLSEIVTKVSAHFGLGFLIALLCCWLLLKLWPKAETEKTTESAFARIIQTGLFGGFLAATGYTAFALLNWLLCLYEPAALLPVLITNFLAFFGGGTALTMLGCLLFRKRFRGPGASMTLDRFNVLVAGFWGAVVSVLIDLDHVTRAYGNPNGRVWHKFWAEIAAALLVYNTALLVINLINAQFNPSLGKDVIYKKVFRMCLCICVIAHVLVDFIPNWF